jgi:hypothetical protein
VKEQGDEEFVRQCFRRVLGTEAAPDEVSVCIENMALLREVPQSNDAKIRHAIVLALLNHNDFITIR